MKALEGPGVVVVSLLFSSFLSQSVNLQKRKEGAEGFLCFQNLFFFSFKLVC